MRGFLKENQQDVFAKVVLFVISPFFSFLYSLRRLNTKSSYWAIFLFCILFGLCFTVAADKTGMLDTSDAARYRFGFENNWITTFPELQDAFLEFIKFEGDDVRDIYYLLLSVLVRLFSDNYHLFFFFASIPFAYFLLKSLKFLTQQEEFNNNLVCLLLCLFFTTNSISNICGFRFWTAAWIGVYLIFQIFYNGNNKYLPWLLVLPMIHRSFFFFWFLIAIGYISRNKFNVFKGVYFFSILLAAGGMFIMSRVASFLPLFFSDMMEGYASSSLADIWDTRKLIEKMLPILYANSLFVIMILRKKHSAWDDKVTSLYNFALVYLTLVNAVIMVPSLGVRYIILSYPLIAVLWIKIIGVKDSINFVIYLMPIILFFSLRTRLNEFVRFQELSFFFTNPISLIFTHI